MSVFFASHHRLMQLKNTDLFFNHQQRKDIQMFWRFAKKGKFIKIDSLTANLLPDPILRNLRSTSGGHG